MTAPHTQTISLSPSELLFSLPFDFIVVRFEEIKSFQGYILSSIISLQLQEWFVIVREI